MKIRRNTQEYGLPAGIIEIELTGEEMEQAFREVDHQYKLEDAKNALHDAYESEQISEEIYEKVEGDTQFYEAVLQEYDKRFSCNIPENAIWEESLKEAMKSLE